MDGLGGGVLIHRNAPDDPLEGEVDPMPFAARVLEVFGVASEPFQVEIGPGGLEIAPLEEGRPGRCRLKLFRPRQGKARLCAFFYKRSNLAWSRDRFSYGGVEFRPEQATDEDVLSWRAWLLSGFDPELRPPGWRRAFLFDVPE
ncbi:MAG TPA: hypothetical protein VFT97_04550 [Candidatus Eisenbacteria bacterium]|nr:hypothetical protein [Candidatus Eisenbacteria bacterium]